jgi:hypothetical protein
MPARPRRDATDDLRFPVPSAPLPAHPAPTVDMILEASAAMLPVWNADPRREPTRLALKCRVRFVLEGAGSDAGAA